MNVRSGWFSVGMSSPVPGYATASGIIIFFELLKATGISQIRGVW